MASGVGRKSRSSAARNAFAVAGSTLFCTVTCGRHGAASCGVSSPAKASARCARIALSCGATTRIATPRPRLMIAAADADGGSARAAAARRLSSSGAIEGGMWWNRVKCAGSLFRSAGKCARRMPSSHAKSAAPNSTVTMIGAATPSLLFRKVILSSVCCGAGRRNVSAEFTYPTTCRVITTDIASETRFRIRPRIVARQR